MSNDFSTDPSPPRLKRRPNNISYNCYADETWIDIDISFR